MAGVFVHGAEWLRKRKRALMLGLIAWLCLPLLLTNAELAGEGASVVAAEQGVPLQVSREGRPLWPIVVAPDADAASLIAARELADYLTRITGGVFEIVRGEGSFGLVVGRAGEFAHLTDLPVFAPDNPLRRDEYLVRTHDRGAWLLGATDLATRFAVWDFLHQAGYRLYFPTDTWEIVPRQPSLRLSMNRFEQPDFVTRQAPRGAPWSNSELWGRWQLRNRVTSSFQLRTGHAYDRIIRTNRETFAAHPEFYALVDGTRRLAGQVDGRGNIKFCISNAHLRQVVTDDAIRQIREQPDLDSISLDPSDGANWCECESCAAFGSISDLALLLANESAQAINELGLGDKFVGIYAYNQHSPPPSIRVHPRVIVSVATSFIRGGHSVEDLFNGWQAAGATLGVREYHDVFAWSHDLPRKARGGDPAYLARTIPWFHERGARYMNSENNDSWGANGFGYWLTPRLLWDVREAEQVEKHLEDFLTRSFGAAAEPMREFYRLLNFDRSLRSLEDVTARLYRQLELALAQAEGDPLVEARLEDLVLYVRYMELYRLYSAASGPQRQALFEQIWRHAYRIHDRMLLSTRAICERDRFRDRAVQVPEAAHYSIPESQNPWKDAPPVTRDEVRSLLREGVQNNQPARYEFTPVDFSEDLIPATPLKLQTPKPGQWGTAQRGRISFYTWLTPDQQTLNLQVRGGLIAHYRDRGNVHFQLFTDEEATLEPVAEDRSVPPDGQARQIQLRSRYTGLHRLEWSDGRDKTEVLLPESHPWTIHSSMEDPLPLEGRWTLYFYVPKGTRVIGGYRTAPNGWLVNPQGERLLAFETLERPDYFELPVPAGQDGALWRIEQATGACNLLTVPSYFARTAEDLLLPREVVEAD